MNAAPRRRKPKAAPTPDLFRLRLWPIAWGKRDPVLGRGVCQNILRATPPRVIQFDPRTDPAMRRELRLLGARSDWRGPPQYAANPSD